MKATVEFKYFNLFIIKVEGRENEMPQDQHDTVDCVVDSLNNIYVVPDEEDGQVSRYDLELVEELRTTFACDHFQTYYMVRLATRSIGYKPNYVCHKAIPLTDAQRFNGIVCKAKSGFPVISQDFDSAESAIVAFFKAVEIVEAFQVSGSLYDVTGKTVLRRNIVDDEEPSNESTMASDTETNTGNFITVGIYDESLADIKSIDLVISSMTRMTIKEKIVWE